MIRNHIRNSIDAFRAHFKSDQSGPQRVKFLAIVAIILIIANVLLSWLIIPFAKEFSRNAAELKKQTQILKDAKDLIKRVDDLQRQFNDLSTRVQTQIPATREESDFLTEISNLASKTSVNISSMNPRPYKTIGEFKELSAEIDMESNLGNLVAFLYFLRESPMALVVAEMQVEPKSELSALLRGRLIISTIFQKD